MNYVGMLDRLAYSVKRILSSKRRMIFGTIGFILALAFLFGGYLYSQRLRLVNAYDKCYASANGAGWLGADITYTIDGKTTTESATSFTWKLVDNRKAWTNNLPAIRSTNFDTISCVLNTNGFFNAVHRGPYNSGKGYKLTVIQLQKVLGNGSDVNNSAYKPLDPTECGGLTP